MLNKAKECRMSETPKTFKTLSALKVVLEDITIKKNIKCKKKEENNDTPKGIN